MIGIRRITLMSTTALAGLVAAVTILGASDRAYADCTPAATAGDDTIACTGTTTGDLDTLAGNDAVDNSGTINGNVTLGADNDTLTLTGAIVGAIDFGDGDDVFQIEPGFSLDEVSPITGGLGTDTLRFDGPMNGSVDISLFNFSGFDIVEMTFAGNASIGMASGLSTVNIYDGHLGIINSSDLSGADVFLLGNDIGYPSLSVAQGSSVKSITGNDERSGVNLVGAVVGDINLGGGDDTLTVRTTASVGGLIDGGSGTDQLVVFDTLNSGITFDLGNFSNFESLNTQVSDSYTVSNATGFSSVNVNAGSSSSPLATVSLTLLNSDLSNATAAIGHNSSLVVGANSVIGSIGKSDAADLDASPITVDVAGSVLGDVNFGAGDDALTLIEDGSIGGSVDGGAGTDSVTVDRAAASQSGIADFSLYSNFENFSKIGVGTFTVTGLDGYSAVIVSDGILKVHDTDMTGAAISIDGSSLWLVNSSADAIQGGALDDTLNLSSDSTVSGGVSLGGGDDIVINSGTITGDVDLGDGTNLFEIWGTGTVTGTVDGGPSVSQFTIVSAGAFVYDFAKYLNFFDVVQWGSGSLTLTGTGNVRGVSADGNVTLSNSDLIADTIIMNSGVLTVEVDSTLAADGAGLDFNGGGNTFINAGTASGKVFFQGATNQFLNSGTFTSLAIRFIGDDGFLNNSGTISGDISFEGLIGELLNDGQITGNIIFGDGNDLLTNSGNILGTIDFGIGDDVFEIKPGASPSALVMDGGSGTDKLLFTLDGDLTLGTFSVANMTGFEELEIQGRSSAFPIIVGAAGFSTVTVNNGTLMLRDASLAGAEIFLNATLDPDGIAWLWVEQGSFVGNITGNDGHNAVNIQEVHTGTIALNGGQDTLFFNSTADLQGLVDGGGDPSDTVVIEADGDLAVDLANFSNFDTLAITLAGIATVSNASGFSKIFVNSATTFVDSGSTLILEDSNLPNAIVAIGRNSHLTVGSLSTLASIEFGAENIVGSSLSILVEGSVLGNITLGGGSDSVTVTGSVGGAISLGDSDDSFEFFGTVAGQVDGGNGFDSLSFDSGTLDLSQFVNFESVSGPSALALTITGSTSFETFSFGTGEVTIADGAAVSGNGSFGGNLVSNGNVDPGNSVGSISVAGNYSQSAAGSLSIEVEGLTIDTLLVDGAVALDGLLNVTFSFTQDEVLPGQTYEFLTATGGVTGTFATVTTNTTQFLDATVTYTANGVSVQLERTSFLLPFFDASRRAIAGQLNVMGGMRVQGMAGDFIRALTFTERVKAGEIIDQLATQAAAELATPILEARHGFLSHLSSRASSLNGLKGAKGRWVTSVAGYGEFGSAAGRKFSTGGAMAISAYGISDRLAVGFAVGGTASDLRIDKQFGDNGHKALDVAGFAGYRAGAMYVSAALGASYNEIDTEHSVLANGFTGKSRGAASGVGYTAALDARYNLSLAGFAIIPEAAFRLASFHHGAYEESEMGNLGLIIEGRTVTSARASAGITLKRRLETAGGIALVPEISSYYEHELGDSSRAVTASFIANPSGSFPIFGQTIDRSRLRAAAGFSARFSDSVSADLRYEGAFGRTYETHRITGGLRVAW